MVEGDSKGVTAPESAPSRVQARENRPQARSGTERVALNRVQVGMGVPSDAFRW